MLRLVVCAGLVIGCGDNMLVGDDGPGGGGDDAVPWELACDDGNACTDDRVEGGACRSVPVEDGRACDDADLCTLGDRCRAGTCVAGERASGPLALRGSVTSFGGGALGVAGDRYLAVTGPPWSAKLALVEPRAGTLATLASWSGPLFVYLRPDEALVQAVANDALAITGLGERVVAVFTATPDTIKARGKVALANQVVSITGHGKRLWLCTRTLGFHEVVLIDLGDVDAPSVAGSLRLPRDCGSIAASDDGQRIYVNTADGVRYIDAAPLDAGGDPTLADVFAPTAGVSTGAGLLLLRGRDAVIVRRQSDHGEVALVAERGVLAASLAGGRLVLEGWRPSGGGLEAYAALYGATSFAKLDEVILQRVPFTGDLPGSFRNALTRDGATLVTSTGQRMFALGADRLDEVRVPALTPLGRLARAVDGVRATGYASSALVDVRDPARPVLASGGAFGEPIRFEAAIEDGSPWPQVLFGTRFDTPAQAGVGNTWEGDPLAVARWRLTADGRARIDGSLRLPNRGPGRLAIAGQVLYRLGLPVAPSTDASLLRWPLAALGIAGEAAPAVTPLVLAPSPPLGTTRDTRRAVFDVDPRTHTAIVVSGAIESGMRRAAAFWLDLAASPPAILEEVHFDGLPDDVRVAGERAVVTTNLELVWLERRRGVVGRATPSSQTFVEHLLAFDGRTAYFAATVLAQGRPPDELGVALFGETGPTPPALRIGDTAETLVETPGGLAVGMPSELVIVHPSCERASLGAYARAMTVGR